MSPELRESVLYHVKKKKEYLINKLKSFYNNTQPK